MTSNVTVTPIKMFRACIAGAAAGAIVISASAAAAAPRNAPPTTPMPLTPPRPITDDDMSSLLVETTLYTLNEPGSMLDLICPIVQADRVNARMRELGMTPMMTGYRFDVRQMTSGPPALFCGPDPANSSADPAAPFLVEISVASLSGTFGDYVQGGGIPETLAPHPDASIGGEFVIHCEESGAASACLGFWGRQSPPAEGLGSISIEVLLRGPIGEVDSDRTFSLLTGVVIDAVFAGRNSPEGTPLLAPPTILTVEATPEVQAVAQGALDATTAQFGALITPGTEAAAAIAATHVAGGPEEALLNETINAVQQAGATVERSPATTFQAQVETVELIDGSRANVTMCMVDNLRVVDSAGASLGDDDLATHRYWYDMRQVDGIWKLNDSVMTGEFNDQTTCAGAPATPLASFVDPVVPAPDPTTA